MAEKLQKVLGIILIAGLLTASFPFNLPAQADDEIPVATWYLPIDTQPVCVDQQVVISGQYNANPTNEVLSPLTPQTITNQASLGKVSPKTIPIGRESGYFSFTYTATQAGTANISSSINGLFGIASITLKVTDKCKFIYGFKVNFDIVVHGKTGGDVTGDYNLFAGGYLKVKDPKNTTLLTNDPQDALTLRGKLLDFDTRACTAANQSLPPRTAPITVTATVNDPTMDVKITKGELDAAGKWTLTCKGSNGKTVNIAVNDVYAQAMTMMDKVAPGAAFATGTCLADGGDCQMDLPTMAFMQSIFPGRSPYQAELILEKVK